MDVHYDKRTLALSHLGPRFYLAFVQPGSGLVSPDLLPFSRYDDAAIRLERMASRGLLARAVAQAWAPDGAPLDTRRLLARGTDIAETRCNPHRFGWGFFKRLEDVGHETRQGPVKGVGRHRGGNYYRHIHTLNEKKLAQRTEPLIEPAPRGARSACNIPDSWDDYLRGGSHCWKEQRKGRKAWDRPDLAPRLDRRVAFERLASIYPD